MFAVVSTVVVLVATVLVAVMMLVLAACAVIQNTGLYSGEARGLGVGVDTCGVSGRVCPLSEFFIYFLSEWCINSGEFCAQLFFYRATHMQRIGIAQYMYNIASLS